MIAAKNKYGIGVTVITPDGLGIIKRIEENCSGTSILYTCVLEKPFKVVDPYNNTREYGFPPYFFGYSYLESQIKLMEV